MTITRRIPDTGCILLVLALAASWAHAQVVEPAVPRQIVRDSLGGPSPVGRDTRCWWACGSTSKAC